MLNEAAPVLPVRDVDRAVHHYRDLGFEVTTYEGGGYAYARRGAVQLHLTQVDDVDPKANTSAVYLYVDDAQALHDEWQGLPGRLIAVSDTPYGLREGAHIDEDGNLLRFGSPIS